LRASRLVFNTGQESAYHSSCLPSLPTMYSQTPTRSVPRLSGLPTPGRTSIPTPGRPRSATGGHGPEGFTRPNLDSEDMTKALSEAIRANDPSSHRISDASSIGAPEATPIMPGRRSAAGGLRPSLVTASRSSSTHSAPSGYADPTPKTPITSFRSKTPVTSTPGASSRMPFTPRQSFASNRPDSRASESRSSSRLGGIVRPFEVGDRVRIESLGMEGTLRFLGEASFKPGIWAGVELSGGFAGRGKNDGSVNGYVQTLQ
jgi:CAP-Gly domain-containing linker protein 1